MPSIQIRDYEAREDLLPDVCMSCGAPATVHRSKNFSWYPSWVVVIMIFALLPGLIVAMVLTKKMRIDAPLCDAHRRHWSMRTAVILLGFLGCMFWTIAAAVNAGDFRANDLETLILFSIPVVILAWLITTVVLLSTSIRASEITDRDITLTGVSAGFIEALDDMRGADRERRRLLRAEGLEDEPRRERRPRGRDEEDDRYRE
jgi:hypothetical protein